MEWTKVEDGLPEFDKDVIVVVDGLESIYIGQLVSICGIGKNWYLQDSGVNTYDVTYWMPMIELP